MVHHADSTTVSRSILLRPRSMPPAPCRVCHHDHGACLQHRAGFVITTQRVKPTTTKTTEHVSVVYHADSTTLSSSILPRPRSMPPASCRVCHHDRGACLQHHAGFVITTTEHTSSIMPGLSSRPRSMPPRPVLERQPTATSTTTINGVGEVRLLTNSRQASFQSVADGGSSTLEALGLRRSVVTHCWSTMPKQVMQSFRDK